VGNEIVQPLHKELAPVKFEPDRLYPLERSVDGIETARPVVTDERAKSADFLDPFTSQFVDSPLEPGDQHELQRQQSDRRSPEHRVLNQHEDQDGQKGAALENRLNEGGAGEAADRLDFLGDDGNELSRTAGATPSVPLAVNCDAQQPDERLGDPPGIQIHQVLQAAIGELESGPNRSRC
jgi:hypothetical protein